MEEHLILVDKQDREVGQSEKLHAHVEGLLHRAFSIFIFDVQGRLLLQQRALSKYHSGGLWTNTCCGHPRPGEETAAAARRRLNEEMGFDCELERVADFIYKAPVSDGLIEHEFDHIYVGRFNGRPSSDPQEAACWEWTGITQLLSRVDTSPDEFTVWFKRLLTDPLSPLGRAWLELQSKRFTLAPECYQHDILRRVSRSFALTIPQLPRDLVPAVTHAYLIMRLADTIEDEPALTPEQVETYEHLFFEAVSGRRDVHQVSAEISALLSDQMSTAERELMQQLPWILRTQGALRPRQREALLKTLEVMTLGMSRYKYVSGNQGLATREDLEGFCYCVAGVVGEMLTEFFIDFDHTLSVRRETLMRLSVSFGLALQLTNILKDQWEDLENGLVWLPRDLLADHGVPLASLQPGLATPQYVAALSELLGTTHAHLRQSLLYVLNIPKKHAGIRRFLLWNIAMALVTLRNIHNRPDFESAAQIKVSHTQLALILGLTRFFQRFDRGLKCLFWIASRGLPRR